MHGIKLGVCSAYKSANIPIFRALNHSPSDIGAEYFNEDEGMIYIDMSHSDPYTLTNNEAIFWISDDSSNNRFGILRGSTGTFRYFISASGVQYLNYTQNTFNGTYLSARFKMVCHWKDGTLSVFYNGEKILEDAITMPSSITAFDLGQSNDGVNTMSGMLHEVKIWNKAPSLEYARQQSRYYNIIDLTRDVARKGVVFAGQSNMTGSDGVGSASYTHTPKLLTNSGDYEDYADPFDDDTDALILGSVLSDSGAALSYAGQVLDLLIDADGAQWYGVPATKNATGLIADWSVWYDSLSPNPDKTILNRAHALNMRGLMGQNAGSIQCLVWHQGEGDAISGVSVSDYKAAALELFNEFRQTTAIDKVVIVSLHKWVAALQTAHGAAQAQWESIQNAHNELASEYAWITLVDISDIEATLDNGLHLAKAQHDVIAPRVASAIETL